MFRLLKGLAVLAVVLGLTACASPEPEKVTVEDRSATSSEVDGRSAGSKSLNPLDDPDNVLSQRLVFFEFDSYTIEPQFRPLIEAHARYLTTHPSATLTLRGHTDERGTHEYNIALGQRRADAVKRVMTLFGVDDLKVETVSFGKEVPRNPGHDEAAWAENRRVEIVYVTR